MVPEECKRDPRQHDHVKRKEPTKRRPRYELIAGEHLHRGRTEHRECRHCTQHLRDGPVCPLVPRQKISGSTKGEHDDEEQKTDEPVCLARGLVRGIEQDSRHMGKECEDDQARRPHVQITYQPAEGHLRHEVLNAGMGFLRRWPVVEREQHARDHQYDEQQVGDTAERVAPADVTG